MTIASVSSDLLLVSIVTLVLVYFFQGSMIFGRPKTRPKIAPRKNHGQFTIQTHQLKTDEGVFLQGWSTHPVEFSATYKVLVYFGGRKEDVFWSPEMATFLKGCTIYAFNYRGFGASTGYPSEKSAKSDALAIHAFIKQRHHHGISDFTVMGRSLGTAIAIWLAHYVKPTRLVLLSPFCSIPSVLISRFWLAPFAPFVRQRFESFELAQSISSRTLIVMAENDHDVTNHDSLILARALATTPMTVTIANADHHTLPRNKATQSTLAAFLSVSKN